VRPVLPTPAGRRRCSTRAVKPPDQDEGCTSMAFRWKLRGGLIPTAAVAGRWVRSARVVCLLRAVWQGVSVPRGNDYPVLISSFVSRGGPCWAGATRCSVSRANRMSGAFTRVVDPRRPNKAGAVREVFGSDERTPLERRSSRLSWSPDGWWIGARRGRSEHHPRRERSPFAGWGRAQ
jgi:hypothetical protein